MKIQEVSSWQNGQEKKATEFILNSSFDNLATSATFQYQLNEVIITPISENEITIYPIYNTLVNGYLTISGQDYIDWGKASDINLWAYEWAAGQLNLVLIPETV
jgi:hypothetical protein